MNRIKPTNMGLITGAAMIAVSLVNFLATGQFDNIFQYVVYAIYVAGILITLAQFRKLSSQEKTFKNFFSQGFQCFIVVTLLMVAFTWIFMQFNSGIIDEMAINLEKDLSADKNKTPSEIEATIARAREYFVPMLISMAIFGYLMIGAVVTAISSWWMRRKSMQEQPVN